MQTPILIFIETIPCGDFDNLRPTKIVKYTLLHFEIKCGDLLWIKTFYVLKQRPGSQKFLKNKSCLKKYLWSNQICKIGHSPKTTLKKYKSLRDMR